MDLRSSIYRYCNYQERCHQEVKNKLYELGANTTEVNELMAELIESGLLNEERFALSFVRGKFRSKYWGKIRITHELRQRRISDYLIRKALKELDLSEYFARAVWLAERKMESLKGANSFEMRAKVFKYLLSKGYESSLIQEVLESIKAGE